MRGEHYMSQILLDSSSPSAMRANMCSRVASVVVWLQAIKHHIALSVLMHEVEVKDSLNRIFGPCT